MQAAHIHERLSMQTPRILQLLPVGLALASTLLLNACSGEQQNAPAGGMPGRLRSR